MQHLLLVLALWFAATGFVAADDWPQYGGPERNGGSREKGLLREWLPEGPPLFWKVADLGKGFSPVSVVGSRVYTLAYRGDEEYVVALDIGTGKELWAVSLGIARENTAMSFLRQRQPVVDEDRLYAFNTAGHLVCLEIDQGKELWRKRYSEDFKGRSSSFGWTDYPLIDGDRLICTPGGKDHFHVALDKVTGEIIWKSSAQGNLAPSHSPMVQAQVDGVRLYVQILAGGLVGIAAKDGKILWRYGKVTNGTANMANPLVLGNRVFAASGYQTGCALLEMSTKDGEVDAKEIYFDRAFQSLYGGMVERNGFVFAGQGPVFSSSNPACYEWKTRKLVWQEKGPGMGAVATIAAEDRLYFRFADGLVVLAEATSAGFKERGRLVPPERPKAPAWSVPVLAHGRLFLRDQSILYCYDLRIQPAKGLPKPPVKPKDEPRQPDAVFVPSPQEVVERMLTLAKVSANDVVYDLGCGDGRVVIMAAQKFKARGIGVELDPDLVRVARASVKKEGLQERVTIRKEDLFDNDFRDATVIALYLLPRLNAKLLPKLSALKPGTRIVSHAFPIPGIEPDQRIQVKSTGGLQDHTVFLYVTPFRVASSGL